MNTGPFDVAGALSGLPIFQQLRPQELAVVSAGTTVVRAMRGQVLFAKGELATALHVLLYGTVKLALSAGTSHEKVLQIIGPGESFGEALLFLEQPYPVSAQCLAQCLVLEVAGDSLMAAIDADPKFARRMLAGLSQRLHELISDVESFSTRTAAQRLVGYLLHLCGSGNTAELPTSTERTKGGAAPFVVSGLIRLSTVRARSHLCQARVREAK